MTPETHHVVVVVGAPEVRTVAGTEVGFVTFWLVDPLPLEVIPEVNVELVQAAALICTTETHKMQFSSHPALQSSNPTLGHGKITTGHR